MSEEYFDPNLVSESRLKVQPYAFEPTTSIASNTEVTEAPATCVADLQQCLCSKCTTLMVISCCRNSSKASRSKSQLKFEYLTRFLLIQLQGKLGDCLCITDTEEFKTVCGDEAVLQTAYNTRHFIRKQRRKERQKSTWNNDSKRFTAYRQFIFWIYSRPLGKNIRKILPDCVYHFIRQRFPSEREFIDFVPGENDNILIE